MFAPEEYKKDKEAVLKLFEEYLELAQKGVAEPVSDQLRKRIEALRKDKFVIAVVGKAKAGKSTFINALLGIEVLPTDRLQSTSTIIEIFKSDHSQIDVVFGDRSTQRLYDERLPSEGEYKRIDEAYQHLQSLASLSEKYRGIDQAAIETFILDANAEETEQLSPSILAAMLHEHFENKNWDPQLIEEFLQERGTPSQIPIQVNIGYPLSAGFNELCLADTPGLQGHGDVKDRTFAYLESARAIVLVLKINDEAIEADLSFFDDCISDRSKQNVLLILTHAGDELEKDLERHVKAKRHAFSEIESDRIILVDSELHLIEHRLNAGLSILQVERQAEKEQDTQKGRLIRELRRNAKRSKEPLKKAIHRRANFDALQDALHRFASRAPYVELCAIVESILTRLDNALGRVDDDIILLEQQLRDPQQVAKLIFELKKKLAEYERDSNDVVEQTQGELFALGATGRHEFEVLRKQYALDLETTKWFARTETKRLRKLAVDINNKVDQTVTELLEKIYKRYREKMKELGRTYKERSSFSVPLIDMRDIEANVKEKVREKSTIIKDVHKWTWRFRLRKPRKEALRLEFLRAFNKKMDAIVSAEGLVKTTVTRYEAEIKKALDKQIEARTKKIERMEKNLSSQHVKKKKNAQVRATLGESRITRSAIEALRNRAHSILHQVKQ